MKRLAEPVSKIFPEFAGAFPLTVDGMERNWSMPAIAVKDMGRVWLVKLFVESDAMNLFFDNPFAIYMHKPYFDVGMLPTRWAALYQSMSSFVITPEVSYSPTGWRNTPLPRSIDVTQFVDETGLATTTFGDFQEELEIPDEGTLRCWLITEISHLALGNDMGQVLVQGRTRVRQRIAAVELISYHVIHDAISPVLIDDFRANSG